MCRWVGSGTLRSGFLTAGSIPAAVIALLE